MRDAASILRSIGWLGGTAAALQNALLSGCQWQWFLKDKAISHGGDTSGGMFGLAPGSVSAIPGLGVPDAPIIHIVSAPFWYGTNPLIDATPEA